MKPPGSSGKKKKPKPDQRDEFETGSKDKTKGGSKEDDFETDLEDV